MPAREPFAALDVRKCGPRQNRGAIMFYVQFLACNLKHFDARYVIFSHIHRPTGADLHMVDAKSLVTRLFLLLKWEFLLQSRSFEMAFFTRSGDPRTVDNLS